MKDLSFSRMTRIACVLAFVFSTILVDCSTGVTPGSSEPQNEELHNAEEEKGQTLIELLRTSTSKLWNYLYDVLDLDGHQREQLEDLEGSLVVETSSSAVDSDEQQKEPTPIEFELSETDLIRQKNVLDLDGHKREQLEDLDGSLVVERGSSAVDSGEQRDYDQTEKEPTPIEFELSETYMLLQENILDLDIHQREELEDLESNLVVERGSSAVDSGEKTVFYDSQVEYYEKSYESKKDPLSTSSDPNKLYEKRMTFMTLPSPTPLAYQLEYDKNGFEKLSPPDSAAKQEHKLRTQADLGNTKNDEDEFTCSTDEYDPFNAKIYKSFHIYHEPEKRITGCQKCLNKCIDAVSTGCSYIGRVTCCRESTDANQHEPVGPKTKRRRMHRSSVWARYGSVNTIY
eukprot:52050_1